MSNARLPEWCLRFGILYLIMGMSLGVFMAAKQNYMYKDVHAHLNLLGYVSTFLMGLFLKAYPNALRSKLAKASVLLVLIAVPITLALLIIFYMGHTGVEPLLGLASIATLAGYVLFGVTVFRVTEQK